MIQTLEAIVDETGKIRLLTEIRLEKSSRALVTILDEEPKVSFDLHFQLLIFFGKIDNQLTFFIFVLLFRHSL